MRITIRYDFAQLVAKLINVATIQKGDFTEEEQARLKGFANGFVAMPEHVTRKFIEKYGNGATEIEAEDTNRFQIVKPEPE